MYICIQFSSIAQSCPTVCDPHGLQHARLPCSSPTPGTCSNSCPSSWWCHPTISSSVVPFSCLQSLLIYLEQCLHAQLLRPFSILWTVACQAYLSMEFSRQEYWSMLPFPVSGDLPNPGIKPVSPVLAAGFFTTEPPGKPNQNNRLYVIYILFLYLCHKWYFICHKGICKHEF